MESKNFNNELDEKLIALVRENKVLYDFQDRNYKDNTIKHNVWKKIGSELGRTGDDCKIRWRTIRDSYRKNLKKLTSKRITGSPAFTKSKYANKNLQFLDNSLTERRPISDISLDADDYELDEGNAVEDHSDPLVDNVGVGLQETGEDEVALEEKNDMEELHDSSDESTETPFEFCSRKKRKLSPKEKITGEIKQFREERNLLLSDLLGKRKDLLQEKEDSHPMDLFFKSMCQTAKSFPPHIAAETKLKVCQVINEMEMKMIQEQDYPSASSAGRI